MKESKESFEGEKGRKKVIISKHNAGELTLVVRTGESWWADQGSNYSEPEPEL